ncbi:SSURE domain-containing protein [Streptococcus mitis]|uniref:Fibronectin-binding repeat protein n=1 Tax=Streptococcus mitis TaxID=28037 RepID=A0A428D0X3_STRMT|nr:fibronectin-binding SSURE repeat-containing protein [Streptococcus mitis]RSI85739.1 Fibronectin-binding repeat protein [Streptococcus mitis]RSI89676.1 Fibronectin-binding repeat protein [Streptococcus mitis]
MKFNPNQRYTRWSIRRLSVGVASVVVASGFFVLVGQPSSVRADVVNPTPAQVVPDAASVSEKSDLPVELLKEAVDTALPSEQADSTPKTSLDATSSPEKVNVAAKDQVVAPKEEVQAKPESKKETEDALKPAPTVSGQDREANEAQPATTPAEVQKGVADNTKDTVDVPATYLDKANFPGPFTAGVNQVIPYEFFAGDGMLTRLILKASDKAPWSDNGSAKNPALPPVEKLGKGLYFYEVDLAGTQGKSDKELLDLLKQNGTQSYKATIKVYGAKDGKADLSNLVATKDLTVNLNGHQSLIPMQSGFVPSSNGSAMPAPMMNSHQDASNMKAQMPSANQDEVKSKMPAASQDKMMPNKEQDKTMNASQPMATPSMKQDQAPAASSKMSDEGKMASNNKVSSPMMADQMKDQKDMLPYTGEAQTSMATLGFFGLALAGLLGGLGLKAKKEEND